MSSVWLGIIHFFAIACIFVWIIVGITTYFDTLVPYIIIAELSFACALITALYSIYHARQIYITHTTVEIRDLPASWHEKKIALITDVHIGHINRARFLREVVKKINKEDVELVCIA